MIAYTRVSTTDQQDNGFSLDAQADAIQSYAKAMDLNIAQVIQEQGSAKDLSRPLLVAALGQVEAGEAAGIIVLRLDRLSRSMRDFIAITERLEACGGVLISVRDHLDLSTPAGRLFARILIDFAQYERELIGQRTREGLARRRAEGHVLGRPGRVFDPLVVATVKAESRRLSLRENALRNDLQIHDVRRILRSC